MYRLYYFLKWTQLAKFQSSFFSLDFHVHFLGSFPFWYCVPTHLEAFPVLQKKKLQSKQLLLALEFLPLSLLQRKSKVTQRQEKKENDGRILNNGITISNKYFKKLLWSLCGKGINGDEIKVEAETLESCCNTWIKDDSDLEVCKDRGYKWNQETQNIFWR